MHTRGTLRARLGYNAINYLYWNFLLEHEDELRGNPRSGPAVLGLRHLDEEARSAVRSQAAEFLANLCAET